MRWPPKLNFCRWSQSRTWSNGETEIREIQMTVGAVSRGSLPDSRLNGCSPPDPGSSTHPFFTAEAGNPDGRDGCSGIQWNQYQMGLSQMSIYYTETIHRAAMLFSEGSICTCYESTILFRCFQHVTEIIFSSSDTTGTSPWIPRSNTK